MEPSQRMHVCIFCCKVYFQPAHCKHSLQKFFVLLERWFQSRQHCSGLSGMFSKLCDYTNNDGKYMACQDCAQLLNSFMDLYHEMKCIEMQLDWNLKTVENIVRESNKVPSRIRQVREILRDDGSGALETEPYHEFARFRRVLTGECSKHFALSYPRVLIRRAGNSKIEKTTNVEEKYFDGIVPWMVSFFAVVFVYMSSSHLCLNPGLEEYTPENNCFADVDFADKKDGITTGSDRENISVVSKSKDDTMYASIHLCDQHIEENDVNLSQQHESQQDCNLSHTTSLGKDSTFLNEDEDIIGTISENEDKAGHLDIPSFPLDNATSLLNNDNDGNSILQEHKDGLQQKIEAEKETMHFDCNICDRKYRTQQRLNNHIVDCHSVSQGLHFCDYCNRSYCTKGDYYIHLESLGHRTMKDYILRKCSDNKKLENHVIAKINGIPCENAQENLVRKATPGDRKAACTNRQEVDTTTRLDTHMEEGNSARTTAVLQDTSPTGPTHQIVETLTLCNGHSYNLRERKKGNSVAHLSNQSVDSDDGNSDCERPVAEPDDYDYKCSPNDENDSSSESSHEGADVISTFSCPICDKSFKSFRVLKVHFKSCLETKSGIRSNSEVVCSLRGCNNQRFAHQRDLKRHEKLHGKFRCNFCRVVKTYAPALANHENKKHGEKNEKNKLTCCPRCKVYKISKQMHYIHHFVLIHLGISMKIRQCNICNTITSNSYKHHFFQKHSLYKATYEQAIFKCTEDRPSCFAYFARENMLRKHIQDVHDKSRKEDQVRVTAISEELSDDDFTNVEHLHDPTKASMMSKSKSDKNHMFKFKCFYCSKKFKKLHTFIRHKLLYHSRSTALKKGEGNKLGRTNIYFCQERRCCKSFRSQEDLDNHKKLHGNFLCNFCDVSTDYAPRLAIHEVKMHGTSQEEEEDQSKRNIDDSRRRKRKNMESRRKFQCARCTFSSGRQSKYIEHHAVHHLKISSPFHEAKCSICNRLLGSFKFMRIHFKNHHNTKGMSESEIQRCEKCPAYFIKYIQLVAHMRKTHGEKVDCVDCHKTFSTPTQLRTHRSQVHKVKKEDFQIVCDLPNCNERFETKYEMEMHKAHSIFHKNKGSTFFEKVACDQCGKMCKGKLALAAHLRVHRHRPPAIPFVCDKCGKTFPNRHKLETHQLTHTGPEGWPYTCSVCSRKCSSKQKLNDHLRTHTKEKPFVCEICGMKFTHRNNLRSHVLKKHDIEISTRKMGNTAIRTSGKNPCT